MIKISVIMISIIASCQFPMYAVAKSFLFDATKAETAGDADWTIDAPSTRSGYARPERFPMPDQCLVTQDTPESFWLGAYSSWGIGLVKAGHHVETLPVSGQITFGNCDNPQDLSHYDVYVVPEPNYHFFDAQKTAILDFVQHGGGLFLIANHCGSDRDNNGWDAPMAWNDLGSETEFGMHFEVDEGAGTENCDISNSGCNNFRDDPSDPILHGPNGTINPIGLHDATTMTIHAENNSTIRPLAWKNDAPQGDTLAVLARCEYGSGRVVLLTDSAPADDGTGDPRDSLVNGWSQNWKLIMNASAWLAQVPGANQYTPCPNPTMTPTCPEATSTPPSATRTPTPPARSPTPSPTEASAITLDILTNQLDFWANDDFILDITFQNNSSNVMIDEYIILDVYGSYFFYPSWGAAVDSRARSLGGGTTGPENILAFVWPAGAGDFEATFWGAVTRAGVIDELYDFDRTTFHAH